MQHSSTGQSVRRGTGMVPRAVHVPGSQPCSSAGVPHSALWRVCRRSPGTSQARQLVLSRRSSTGVSSVATAAASTGVDMAAEVSRLQTENALLRRELARYQGCSPEEVVISPEGVAAGAAVAAPSEAGTAPGSLLEQLESGINWPEPNTTFWLQPPRKSPLPVAPPTLMGNGRPRDGRQMHIVHVTAEMAPIAKVGGLGDVVTGLAKACLARGHNVEVVLPFYECLPVEAIQDLKQESTFQCPKARVWDGEMQYSELTTQVWTGKIEGCPVVLLRPDWGQCNLFKGSRIYGGSYNEPEAYLYFSRAVLEFLQQSGRQPDIIHCHEWQSGAVPMLFWELYGGIGRGRVVMTIHNMDSSGEVREDEFAHTGVPGEMFKTIDKALDERTIGHNPERLCLLKGGIIYSNLVTTVSPNYAQETLTGGAAGWLRSVLAKPEVSVKYSGVLNGIDVEMWDPACDPLLPANFNADHPEGKALCKQFLQKGLGLSIDPSKPLVACITRLVPQKGIHLIEHAVRRTAELGGQFVLLGSGHAEGGLKNMAENAFKDNPDVQLRFLYSEPLAHLIYAASDMFLVPSMFEPCGLTQMIALRYGSVPVVRATGGLADTVKDVDNCKDAGAQRNGFSFDGIDAGSLDSALDRAVAYYKQRPDWWKDLVRQNMQTSERWSWDQAADSYMQLYNKAVSM